MNGKVLAAPPSSETWKKVGAPSMAGSAMNTPLAGLDQRSAIESSTAIRVPAIPRFAEGTVRNWSPLATGTVRMGMSWAPRCGAAARRSASRAATGTVPTEPGADVRACTGAGGRIRAGA